MVNGVSSPIARSAIVSPIAAGAGHIAGGTTANLIAGQNFGDAFANSFEGIGKSMAMGMAIGVATTIAVSYANGINPWTGKALGNSSQTTVLGHYPEYTQLADDLHANRFSISDDIWNSMLQRNGGK